ncbi:MAG: hypothetical protein AB7S48_06020 [Bacteroidales bacterium]
MKKHSQLLFVALMLTIPFFSNAQTELIDYSDQPGGGSNLIPTYFNSSICKTINNYFTVSFQTQSGVNQPINLQVLSCSSDPEVHVVGVTVVSFNQLSTMYELNLEIIIDVDNTPDCPITELCPLIINTYRYNVTIKTNGSCTYSSVEI